ncbi:MAG: transcriptional regulator NrdR [Candidatus Melainabacteria bacterium RIFCSPHIGHO2_02_FULL_34_12]|nr:MAG: transcriptional regulator NrdR [Candidatus Melainabacteria bacterium RIFCSPHIGHO2_02_FULL_34_12]
MLCPFCNSENSRVLESRTTEEGSSIRRRRECENSSCNKRFTTYERIEVMPVLVVKRSGEREPYSREKLRSGIVRACEKTLINAEQIDNSIENIENELAKQGKREVSSAILGKLVLNELKDLDQVAYVRFASVYRQFRSIDDFIKELQDLQSDNAGFKLNSGDFVLSADRE